MAPTGTPLQPPPSYGETEGLLAGQASGATTPRPAGPPKPRPPLPLDIPVLNQLRGKRIILASASPRRKQLIAQLGLPNIEILPSNHPENHPKSLGPIDYVHRTATSKLLSSYQLALAAQASHSGASPPPQDPALVISADTIVVSSSGSILEKPRSEAHHLAMLKMLRDEVEHKVYTAVCVLAPRADARSPGYRIESWVEETTVKFAAGTSDEMVLAYVRTREGVDKAGGYGIQGVGSVLVEGVTGSWDNVVGLPVRVTLGLIEKLMKRDEEGSDVESGAEEEEEEV